MAREFKTQCQGCMGIFPDGDTVRRTPYAYSAQESERKEGLPICYHNDDLLLCAECASKHDDGTVFRPEFAVSSQV